MMFHLAFFLIVFTLVVGFSSLIFSLVIYLKERNILLRHYLMAANVSTFILMTLQIHYYFSYFGLFPDLLPWLRLAANLSTCLLIASATWEYYSERKDSNLKLMACVFRVVGIVLAIMTIIIFFFYREAFYFLRDVNVFMLLVVFVSNFFLVLLERNPLVYQSGINWSKLPRIQAVLYIIFWLPIFLSIMQKPFSPVGSQLGGGFLMIIAFYVFIHLSSLIFLIGAITKPYYDIKTVSVSPEMLGSFGFSGREAEIAIMLFQGLSYKSIGDRLFISPKTIKTHAKNIYRKTGAKARPDLIKLFQNGVLRNRQ